jgi:hypothetical protein
MHLFLGAAFFFINLWSPHATAQPKSGFKLEGRWRTPLGVMKLSQTGNKVFGKVSWVCKVCPFKRGSQVFKGVMLEDSISGRMRYCLKGKKCGGDAWAPLVMLIAREGKLLSGAGHYKKTPCRIGGKGRQMGIVMRKLKPLPKKAVPPIISTKLPPKQATAKKIKDKDETLEAEVKKVDPSSFEKNAGTWQSTMEEGANQMDAGLFERARRNFKTATGLDPTRPEAFIGMGVTYYARNDYAEALNWYKKALEVNPDFGDAYYNMACIYSLQKKLSLAFRYLNIAALDGFVQPQVLAEDPDLANLRSDPRYKEIMRKMSRY